MTEARYREATRDDAPAIAALHADNWRRSYRGNLRDEYLDGDVHSDRLRTWTARLDQPAEGQFVCVAVEGEGSRGGGRIVGFVCAFGAHDREWGSFIDNLHVDAGRQGQGIGSGLMRRAGAWLAHRFPDERVHLLVWESNPARSLYERLGGRDTGMIEVENPGGGTGRYHRYVWERPDLLGSRP
jgi:ribosomal protein S18 acetylase RimI-like enzyme